MSGSLQGAGGIGGMLARMDMGLWIGGNGLAHAYYHSDGNGNVTCLCYNTGMLAAKHLYDPFGNTLGLWIGDIAFATAFYHSDGNGNVTCLINQNGLIAAKYLYDPYGNTLSQYGTLGSANNYRFSSKEWNGNLGLYFFGGRYYDPTLQRWPNHDRIQELGGLNLYGYAANNPINYIDPLGLSLWGRVGNGFTGAATGAGAGALTGAGVGAVAGATAGAVTGAIGGFVGGVLSDPDYNAGQSAGSGAINGGRAGLTGDAGEVGGIAWGAGIGALVGGASAGLSTDGDPGAIAGGGFFGGGLGGLGAAASDLSPWESGVFAPTGKILGQDVGGYIDLFNNFPGPNSPKKSCP